MEGVYILVYYFKRVHNILEFDGLFGVLGINYIGQLHFGLLVFLKVVAHDHDHYRKDYVHVELILSFYQQLIDNELRTSQWQECTREGQSEVLKTLIQLSLLFLRVW